MSRIIPRGQPADGVGQYPSGSISASASATTIPGDGADSSDPNAWWWSPQAETIKYAVVGGIIVVFILALLLSSLHARHRINNGLEPLAYHRWLVRRRMHQAQLAPYNQNNSAYYRQQEGYNMEPYVAPPPAYNAEHDYVPAYTPPAKDSKIHVTHATTEMPNEGGPSQPPAVANPSRPIES